MSKVPRISANYNNQRLRANRQWGIEQEGGISAQVPNAGIPDNENDERLKITADLVEQNKQLDLEPKGNIAAGASQSAQTKKSFWSRVVAKFGKTDTALQKAAVVAMIFFSSISVLPMVVVLFATLYSDAFNREESLSSSLSSSPDAPSESQEQGAVEEVEPVSQEQEKQEQIECIISLQRMFHFFLGLKDGLHIIVEIVHSTISLGYIRMKKGDYDFKDRVIDSVALLRERLDSPHFDPGARLAIYDFVQSKIENFQNFLLLEGNEIRSMDRNFQDFLWACDLEDLRDLITALGNRAEEMANDLERRWQPQAKVLFCAKQEKQKAEPEPPKGIPKRLTPGSVAKRDGGLLKKFCPEKLMSAQAVAVNETNTKDYEVLIALYIKQQRSKGRGDDKKGLYRVCEKLAAVVEEAAVGNKKQIREFMKLHAKKTNIDRGDSLRSYIESFTVDFVLPMTSKKGVKNCRKEMRARLMYFLVNGAMMKNTSQKIPLAESVIDLDLIQDRFKTLLSTLEESNVRPLQSVLRQIENNLAGRIKIKGKERRPSSSYVPSWK